MLFREDTTSSEPTFIVDGEESDVEIVHGTFDELDGVSHFSVCNAAVPTSSVPTSSAMPSSSVGPTPAVPTSSVDPSLFAMVTPSVAPTLSVMPASSVLPSPSAPPEQLAIAPAFGFQSSAKAASSDFKEEPKVEDVLKKTLLESVLETTEAVRSVAKEMVQMRKKEHRFKMATLKAKREYYQLKLSRLRQAKDPP